MRVNDCSEFWLCNGCDGWERMPPWCSHSSATFLSRLRFIWAHTECGGLHLYLRAHLEDYPLGVQCGSCGEPAGYALSCCITMHSLGSSAGVLTDPVLSFLWLSRCACVPCTHGRDRSNKLTGSAASILQDRSRFKFSLELTNNKGISLQNFTPVEVNFSLVFRIWYF